MFSRTLLVATLACTFHLPVFAEDYSEKPAPVDDPIGLGERLALIDYLRDTHKVELAAGSTLGELRQKYWELENKPDDDDINNVDEALLRDSAHRLRKHLESKYQQKISERATYEELLALKKQLESRNLRMMQQRLEEEKAREAAMIKQAALEKAVAQQNAANAIKENNTKSEQAAIPNWAKHLVYVNSNVANSSGVIVGEKGIVITSAAVAVSFKVGDIISVFYLDEPDIAREYTLMTVRNDLGLCSLKPSESTPIIPGANLSHEIFEGQKISAINSARGKPSKTLGEISRSETENGSIISFTCSLENDSTMAAAVFSEDGSQLLGITNKKSKVGFVAAAVPLLENLLNAEN